MRRKGAHVFFWVAEMDPVLRIFGYNPIRVDLFFFYSAGQMEDVGHSGLAGEEWERRKWMDWNQIWKFRTHQQAEVKWGGGGQKLVESAQKMEHLAFDENIFGQKWAKVKWNIHRESPYLPSGKIKNR